MRILLLSVVVMFFLSTTVSAEKKLILKPDAGNWVEDVVKDLSTLLYNDSGEIISIVSFNELSTVTYIRTKDGLFRWVETLNPYNYGEVKSVSCQRLMKPNEAVDK